MQYLQLFPLPYVHVGLPSDTPEQSPVKLQLSKRALSKRKLSKLSQFHRSSLIPSDCKKMTGTENIIILQ